MIKNTQIKMIIVFIILGLLAIGTIGIISINEIGNINQLVIQNIDESSSLEISKVFTEKINSMKLITGICMFLYLVTLTIVGIFSVKKIVAPITNFIKTFEENKDNLEQEKNKYLIKQKTSGEQNEFISAFQLITKDLNEDLNNIKEQKKQIETILVHMTDGIIAFNLKGEVIYINPAAISLLELEKEDNNFDSIFKRTKVEVNLEKLIYLDELTSSEQKVSIGNRYVTILFKTFKDRNDKNAGVIVLIQDITEHVKLDNMRKEFVADVSHELKTPLMSISGYAELIENGMVQPADIPEFASRIHQEANRLTALVQDIIQLSKLEEGTSQMQEEVVDLYELTEDIGATLHHAAKKKDITMKIEGATQEITGVRQILYEMLYNLMDNGIKYNVEHGILWVRMWKTTDKIYWQVEDTGIGIAKEEQERVYERFYRVDKSHSRQTGGTGLGLSIVKHGAALHHAQIRTESQPGQGTKITIGFPLDPI